MLHENVKVSIYLVIDIHNYILPEKTEHAKYSAKDLTIRHDNRLHGIIFLAEDGCGQLRDRRS